MTIGINGNEANVKHRVGVGQYTFELLSHLGKNQVSGIKHQIYLSHAPLADLPKVSDTWHYKIFGPRRLWTLTGLQRKLIQEKINGTAPDVFFTPTHYTPLYMPMPSVISIMDLAFEKFSGYYTKKDYLQLKYWTQASVMIASKILTISEHTKKDICSLYAVIPDKVAVTYPGYDTIRFNLKIKNEKIKIKNVIKKYKIRDPYFLFLGTLQPRKNLLRLIEAFYQLQPDSYQLVIAGMISEGRGGWMYQEIFDKVKALGLEKRVIFTGYVPDEEVPYLMAGAKAYVLPSLYEGFGIPAIEAMALGTPVVVSKISSLPEICGDIPTYIDKPQDVSSIRHALESVTKLTPAQAAKMGEFGRKWVKRYNWEETAKKTLQVLQEEAERH